jgi:hypothetical protein
MFEVWLGKIVKYAFGVKDDRKQELVQYKEYEIYLTPRQEGVYDVGIYKYGRSVNQVIEVSLTRDHIIRFAKEWIDENEQWNI